MMIFASILFRNDGICEYIVKKLWYLQAYCLEMMMFSRLLQDPWIFQDPRIFSKSRSRDSQKSNPGIENSSHRWSLVISLCRMTGESKLSKPLNREKIFIFSQKKIWRELLICLWHGLGKGRSPRRGRLKRRSPTTVEILPRLVLV